mgnify:CR=1 FL=1
MKLNNNDDSHNSGLNLLIYNMLLDIESHPAWVCGLKPSNALIKYGYTVSHPAWVCGLKLHRIGNPYLFLLSHPAWVCGLKPERIIPRIIRRWSHPAWVCGLKHDQSAFWTTLTQVTPCVGVWIETCFCFRNCC